MWDVTTIEQGGPAKVHDGVSGMQLQVNSCMPCESARNETMYNSDPSNTPHCGSCNRVRDERGTKCICESTNTPQCGQTLEEAKHGPLDDVRPNLALAKLAEEKRSILSDRMGDNVECVEIRAGRIAYDIVVREGISMLLIYG